LDNINAQELNSKRKFCADVIESMRKWTIWSGTNDNVKKNVFKSPANVEGFFMKVKHIIGDGNEACFERKTIKKVKRNYFKGEKLCNKMGDGVLWHPCSVPSSFLDQLTCVPLHALNQFL